MDCLQGLPAHDFYGNDRPMLYAKDKKLASKVFKAKTPIEKIKACLEFEIFICRIKEIVHNRCTNTDSHKDADKSKLSREKGNCVFAGSTPLLAVPIYGEALRYAPHGSHEETLAFANRSAVFLHANQFTDCVRDIDRALPKATGFLRLKLLVRKAKAFHKIGEDFSEVVQEVENSVHSTEWDVPKEKVTKLVAEMLKEVSVDLEIMSSETETHKLPRPFGGFNPEFPNASNFVELRENPKKGRYVVAKQDFQVGDVIFVEKPASYVLLQPYSLDHCQYCCHPVKSFIPCKSCSKVVFCGDTCRDAAWERFHRFECPKGIVLCQNAGIAHLAFRMAVENHKFPPSLQLRNHLNKMNSADQVEYALSAIMFQIYIEREVTEIKADIELAAKILVFIAELISNGHGIPEVIFHEVSPIPKQRILGFDRDVRVGTGIFPATSMMNHSCVRQIINCFHGTTLIVKAAKPIKAGEEICNTYGIDCTEKVKAVRQVSLKTQYFFDCECEACTAPVDPAFKYHALRCPMCNEPFLEPDCPTCGPPSCEFLTQVFSLRFNITNINPQRPFNTLNILKADSEKLIQCFNKDHLYIMENYHTSALCHALLKQFVEAYKQLEVCSKMFEDAYGPWSAELGNILAEQASIGHQIFYEYPEPPRDHLRLFIIGKCRSIFVRALRIVLLHFGEWSQKYCELNDLFFIFSHAIRGMHFPQYETEHEENYHELLAMM